MPATLPRIIPNAITAGDTVQFTRPGGDYKPADGWALKYTIVSATEAHNFAGTAAGDDYAVTIAAADTDTWGSGSYTLTEYVENSSTSERHTLNTQPLTVKADLATATAGIDTRTHAQKVLDTINAYLEGGAQLDHDVMVDGRRLTSHPLPDLLKLRDRYQAMVNTEARRASGRAPRILTRL